MDLEKLAEEARQQVAFENLFKGGNAGADSNELIKEAVQELKAERDIEKAAEEGYLAGYMDASGGLEKDASEDAYMEGYLAAVDEMSKEAGFKDSLGKGSRAILDHLKRNAHRYGYPAAAGAGIGTGVLLDRLLRNRGER